MKKLKQTFHIISYLQYGFLVIAMYFMLQPVISGTIHQDDSLKHILISYNKMLIFMGLAISFSSLQDTKKVSMKFEKKIWQNPKKAVPFLIYMTLLPVFTIGFGIYGYFLTSNPLLKELSFGSIVLGIGLIGFLKVALEIYDNHQRRVEEK